MPPHFLTIPREVRDHILGYCLLYDGEIIPCPTWYEVEDGDIDTSQPLPCTALLAVNKLLRAEAAAILYGKNTWRIPDTSNRQNGDQLLLAALDSHRSLLRHATMSLDYRACNLTKLMAISKDLLDEKGASLLHNERAEKLHYERMHCFLTEWSGKLMVAHELMLHSLRVDLTNAYCPNGCCRVVWAAAIYLSDMLEQKPESLNFTVTGLTSSKEVTTLHRVEQFRCDDCYVRDDEPNKRYCPKAALRYAQGGGV